MTTRQHMHVGDKFNRLTYLGTAIGPETRPYGSFQCDCSAKIITRISSVINGTSKSCGCLQREVIAKLRTTHGHARGRRKTPTYAAWKSMLERCRNPNYEHFDRYGGRGISVCVDWFRFEAFIADLGECPIGLTLDRRNPDGNYEPSNCRWASKVDQANNTSTIPRYEFQGKNLTAAEWAREIGMDPKVLWSRLSQRKWSVERALTQPLHIK